MPHLKKTYRYILYLGLILVTADCSVEKNTGSTRFYHSLTARYNIYFNGYESFKSGVMKVTNGYRDDYAEILRVFEYSDPSSASLCSSDMEKAIQKASKLISLKSITAKPEAKDKVDRTLKGAELVERKEYNEWVDDSYLLIGKARFYKHEFSESSAVFDYCIAHAYDPDIRKEAAIWLARINDETGKYSEAYRILGETEISGKSSKSLRSMYYSTLADHFTKQKKYQEAIEPLLKAINLVSGKKQKCRLTYLLAQLNEHAGNSSEAISLYHDVVKMHPPYDLEFNARINIAGTFDVNSENPQELKKELEKMLRDIKNKDFQDQIYYALGSLSMKEGDETGAIEYFRKSATSKSQNPNQKGRSYLALAEYFYKKPDFITAGKYYDSTVFFLDQKHPDYKMLKSRSQDLNSVVSQLTLIDREDSLQKVAGMSEPERTALINKIITDITKAESEGKTSDYSDRYNLGQYYENERRFQGNIDQEGKWYFYNQSALAFGRTEFRRRWGERKLEDNWNRVNKTRMTTQAAAENEENTQNKQDTAGAVNNYKKPEFYLKNLPLNDSLLVLSNGRIALAYLNAGKAYFEKLGDAGKATETLEKLISRYPENDLVPEALYNLYKINSGTDKTKSEIYRQRLLEKYPDTEFARILSDPGYFARKTAEGKMAEQLYESAYDSYMKENFSSAVSICDEGIQKYDKDNLAPKFMLLRAYCVARTTDEKSFKDELQKVIKSWPASVESKKAVEIIAYLNQKLPELKVEEEKKIAEEIYTMDTTRVHDFAVIIEDPAFNINQANFDVISYNIDNYTNENYRTIGELVDKKYIMITVSGFSNYRKALDYFYAFNVEKNIRNIQGARIYSFIISNDNLDVLRKDKNPERYRLFFKENYK